MAQRLTRVSLAVLLALALVAPPPVARACGPDFSPPIFIESKFPDVLPEAYAAGHLGVVLPTYVPSELVVAYRYFSGNPLTASEQKQFVTLRNHYQSNEAQGMQVSDQASVDWYSALDEVKNVPVAEKPQVTYASAGPASPYEEYENCLVDAYRTAQDTLKAREQEFGQQSPAVASWASAQEIVFNNCSGHAEGEQIQVPSPADPSLPLEIRQDRDYQIAAAYFYGGDWDEAEKRFLEIARDSSSPWRAISGLVAARCEIRKATLGTDDPIARQKNFDAADAQLRKIIASPAFRSVKAGAERLRGYVEFRSQPEARLIELGQTLERGASPNAFAQDVDDYVMLLGRGRWKMQDVQPDLVKSPLTDWMLSLASADRRSDAEAHRIERWHETTSNAWLIAALTYADKDTPQLSELLDAAAFVPANSPAYLTVAFHRNRLLVAQGKDSEARDELDKILRTLPSGASISTRNLFLAVRMRAARNLDEFLEFAVRQEIGDQPGSPDSDASVTVTAPPPSATEGTGGAPGEFDADAAATLTQAMPTQVLVKAAANPRLPKALRLQIAQAAWVRAILLNEDEIARKSVPALSGPPEASDARAPFYTPFQTTPSAAEPAPTDSAMLIKSYQSASTPDARRFAAVFLILHEPGLRPSLYAGEGRETLRDTPTAELDDFRDNWWCSFAPPLQQAGGTRYFRYSSGFYSIYTNLSGPFAILYPTGNPDPPHFLSADERKTADAEWKSIMQLGSAPDWLAEQTLEWAKAHPADPRVPEALSLVVRSTHYGCSDADTGKYSKEAFTLLHQRYPKSDWTADTPYWYN